MTMNGFLMMNEFFDDNPLIRFRCGGCTQWLEVPVGNVGKKFRCPACFHESLVPEKSVESPPEEMLYGVTGSPSDVRDILKKQEKFISLLCGTCHTLISVPQDKAGTQMACPDCGTFHRVPESDEKPVDSSPTDKNASAANVEIYGVEGGDTSGVAETENFGVAGVEKETFPVYCPMCGTLLYATEDQIGQKLKCPDCEHDVPVREVHRPLKKETFQPKFYEGGTDFNILEGQKLPPDVKLIPVVCSLCHTLMYATYDQAGQEKECPDCGRMSLIIAPPVEELLTAAELFPPQEEYNVNEDLSADRPVPRFNVDYRTVSGSLHRRKPQLTDGEDFNINPEDVKKGDPRKRKKGKKRELEKQEEIEAFDDEGNYKGLSIHWKHPELPSRPLTARFWSIFFHPSQIVRIGALLFFLCLSAPLISAVLAGSAANIHPGAGIGAAGSAVGFLAIFLVGGIILLFSGMYLIIISMAVFSTTSNGGDEVADWGEFSLATGVLALYYLVAAIVPGILPEVVWRIYAEKTGTGNVPAFMTPLSGLAVFLLFPVIMMAVMESSNRFFFRRGVFRSFFLVPAAWLRFYLLSLLTVIVPGGLLLVLLFGYSQMVSWICFALVICLPICTIAYFRLLGRLGWIIEDAFRKKQQTEEEKNQETEKKKTMADRQ